LLASRIVSRIAGARNVCLCVRPARREQYYVRNKQENEGSGQSLQIYLAALPGSGRSEQQGVRPTHPGTAHLSFDKPL
jgi:hypothetical protein